LFGEADQDRLYGGSSNDYLDGGTGNDYLDGGTGNDRLLGFTGNDLLLGDAGDDILHGEQGRDYLWGEAGRDTLFGGAGSDFLSGGSGNDYLDGYGDSVFVEYDVLVGGSGADRFVLGTASKGLHYRGIDYATITDFSGRDGDKIQVRGSSNTYDLDKTLNFGGSSASDTALYKNGDLIAVIQDTTNVSLSRNFVSI
jgi:Ca2+-binding RTX toxin-like protein